MIGECELLPGDEGQKPEIKVRNVVHRVDEGQKPRNNSAKCPSSRWMKDKRHEIIVRNVLHRVDEGQKTRNNSA